MRIPETINSSIITSRIKFIVFVFIYIIGGIALAWYLFYLTKSYLTLGMGMFVVFFFPIIFQKQFRKKFSQNVLVSFSQTGFIIEYSKLNMNNQIKKDIISLENVKQFKSSLENNNDFSTLIIILKDGCKLDYTFSGQNNDDISETDINLIFKKIVESYNKTKKPEERIKLIPSFYATKAALYLGLTLILVMAIVTIYFGIKKPETFIMSIGFIGIYLQMVLLRKRAMKEKAMFE